jgi:hypothetical protein
MKLFDVFESQGMDQKVDKLAGSDVLIDGRCSLKCLEGLSGGTGIAGLLL